MSSKKCKQCTRLLPDTDEYFRSYVSRGRGIRKSTVGRNTVCKECESTNNIATRIWKQLVKSQDDQTFLTELAEYYKRLVAKGGQPIGAYAKHVLGEATHEDTKSRKTTTKDSVRKRIVQELSSIDVMLQEYNKLMQIDLVDEPDVYQDLLQDLQDRCMSHGEWLDPVYRQKYLEVATKFDEYEDNYDWDK